MLRRVLLLLCAASAVAATTTDAPIVLTVAGSDSGGGAGIQADLKTGEAQGVFGTTAIVALTAQNTQGVQAVKVVDTDTIRAQIDSVLSDMGAHAVKTGMLPTVEIIHTVNTALNAHNANVRVIDPVFVAASGDVLVSDEAVEAIRTVLVPTATVLTPNMPEAGKLLGRAAPASVSEMRDAAKDLVGLGARSVLLKGGRLGEDAKDEKGRKQDMVDIYADRDKDGVRLVELRYARVETSNTHGAGCTVAAAVAAELAKQVHAGSKDVDTLKAVRDARTYLANVFKASADLKVGKGERGPLNHGIESFGQTRSSVPPLTMSHARGVSDALWTDPRVKELADASLRSGFLTSLSAGTLPRESFAGYVAQDKFFLEAFSQAYVLAITKLPKGDTDGAHEFAQLVKGVVDELNLHEGYAKKWGVDMTSVTPVPQCKAYVDFLMEVAESADYDVASCAAAMVPCMRLYAYLGQTIKAQQQQQRRPGGAGQFQEWVDTYADPGFEELAATLEALLDRYASAASKEEVNKLRSLYVRAMELELDFFEAWSPRGEAGTKEEL